jgi:hypothetical protein
MKLILLITFSSLFASAAIAQRVNYPPAPNSVYVPYGNQHAIHSKSALLWSNDVSQGLDWSFSTTSWPPNDWSIESDSTYISTSRPIETTSSPNGFLVFSSQVGFEDALATYVGLPIDLTGQSNVRLIFQQQFVADSNERSVELSTDGISWTPFSITDGTLATSERMSDLASLDISIIAANAPNLFMRFRFTGSNAGYWAIDDIELRSMDSLDIRAVHTDWGTIGNWGVRMPYYSIIPSQLQPITFCQIIANDGLIDCDTAIYSISIPEGSFTVSDTFPIQANSIDTICSSQSFFPQGMNISTVNQTISMNGNEADVLNNQIANFQFRREDDNWSVYARDDLFAGVQGGITNQGILGEEYEVGNVFDFFNTGDYCQYMEVQIHPNAPIGASVYGKIYEFDELTNEFNFIPIGYSFESSISSWDLGESMFLPMILFVELEENRSYLVVVGSYDYGDSSTIVFATSGSSKPNTSFLLQNMLDDVQVSYLTETPMVRLGFSIEGLNEFQSRLRMKCYPNPANESTTISFELLETSDVEMSLVDLSGKIIETKVRKNELAGLCEIEWNTRDLENGAYFIKLSSNHGGATQKILIQH